MSPDKQKRYDLAYLKMAQIWGELSHYERKKVGALKATRCVRQAVTARLELDAAAR